LLEVAQPIATALAVLVGIEARPTSPQADAVEPALQALREALRLLQLPANATQPAAQKAMAAVAQALGSAHDLSAVLESASTQPLAGRAVAEATPAAAPTPKAPASAALARTALAGSPADAPAAAAPAAKPQAAAAKPPQPARAAAKPQPAPPAAAAELEASAEFRAVEAALGAHSATNFYKGLAGGDIVASGGLFVATYQVPEVGEQLLLKVSMPGGYEFEAKGVVAWTRDVQMSGSLAPGAQPGFGAQFSEISDEGRGLIQRYVRNREPLFHDDL
jgi:hypothetical protein